MAKVTNPLMSISATGQLGKVIIFAGMKGQHRAYKLVAPKNTGVADRKAHYSDGCTAWKALTPEQKAEYNTTAKALNLNGFNLFMRGWMNSFAPEPPPPEPIYQNWKFDRYGTAPRSYITEEGAVWNSGTGANATWHKAASTTEKSAATGSWYYELLIELDLNPLDSRAMAVGIAPPGTAVTSAATGIHNAGAGGRRQYNALGQKSVAGASAASWSAYGETWAQGDIIGVAIQPNGANTNLIFYKNGISQGIAITITGQPSYQPHVCAYANNVSQKKMYRVTPEMIFIPDGFEPWG